MRYYNIQILNRDGSVYNNLQWSTLNSNNQINPGALRVILDVAVINYSVNSQESAHITILGVDLKTISQANQLVGKFVKFSVGMSKGLPLANPNEVGPAIYGTIWQAYGNWIGNNMSLDLLFYAYSGDVVTPANFTLNWKKGQQLSTVLTNTLTQAFSGSSPTPKINMNISNMLILNYDEPGQYSTLNELSNLVYKLSKNIIGNSIPNYLGVSISRNNTNEITVYDGTVLPTPKQILYTDIIGQPVWIDSITIQVALVMRGDLNITNRIQMPVTNNITTPNSQSFARNYFNFTGIYFITRVRLVGDSRQPSAESWVTIINCYDTGTGKTQ